MIRSLETFEPGEHDILIVDDNPENLKVLGNFLAEQGFNVRAARDGQQALDSVEAAPPELILLDIHMPEMDGYDACRRLKADSAFENIPVIFLSALGETFNKLRAFEAGGVDYIAKPFELEEVRMRVTTHLIASRVLAESRAGFRASFEQAAVGMLHARFNGCITAANTRLCEMLERPSSDLIGRGVETALPQALGHCIGEALDCLQQAKGPFAPRDLPAAAEDGASRCYRVTASRVEIATNLEPYAAVIVEDISAHSEAEQSRRQMAAALEQSPDATAITDANGHILYANRAYEEAAGEKRQDLAGRELPLFTQPMGENAADIRDAVAAAGAWSGRVERVGEAGNSIVEEHQVSPVLNDAGDVLNYVAVTRDITRQLRLEDQLRQSQKMEAIGTLAAGIAHDFNNLLAAIAGFTELALEDLPPESETSANLREVTGAVERARELVSQIRAFGRQSEYQVRPIAVRDAIEEVIRLLRRTIPPTIEFQCDLEEECPPVLADSTAIHQILMNLCTNAYHAMEESGGVLGIRLSPAAIDWDQLQGYPDLPPGTYARIEVSDTGVGMNEVTRQRIFEPFYTTKERVGGTGLGLATVHGIVSDLGGAIHVYSEPGMGSTFSVILPVATEANEADMIAPGPPEPGNGEHILFVDDEAAICRFAEKALQRLGYRATTVSDPKRAVELVHAAPGAYDAIITDEMMPQMRGSELLDRVRAVCPDTPVILYSGFSRSRRNAPPAGHTFSAHIMKPMVTSELARAIREVLPK